MAHGMVPISFSISLSVTPFAYVYVLGNEPRRLGVIIANCSGFNVLQVREKSIYVRTINQSKISFKFYCQFNAVNDFCFS